MKEIEFKILSREVLQDRLHDLIRISIGTPHENWEKQNYLSELPGKWELSMICISNGILFGYIIASLKERSTVHIHKFIVNPDQRGRGIGKLMIKEFAKSVKFKGNKLTLKVYIDNQSAIDFYKSQGFRIVEERGELYLMEMGLKKNE